MLLPQLDPLDERGTGPRQERNQSVMLLGVIDDRPLELVREDVAHDAHREIGFLEDQRRSRRLGHTALEHLTELEQVEELALQVGSSGALGRGADDRAGALQIQLLSLLAKPLPLALVEPPGDADALPVGGIDHVAPGDREVHRQARALGLQRVLDHLDDDLLTGLEQICDLPALAALPASTPGRLDARQHDLVDVQEPVLLETEVHEGGLEAGEDVVHAALVDVSDDRACAATLDVQLCDPEPRTGVGLLAAPAHGGLRGRLAGRFE